MNDSGKVRVLVCSVVKHDYIANAVHEHPRFELVAVTDDPGQPDWVHERNQRFADEKEIPYQRDLDRAIAEYSPDIAVVSSQAERHCELSIKAVSAGLHLIVDKPLSTRLEECDRLVQAVRETEVKTLVWNRNFLPSLLQTQRQITDGVIGDVHAIHCDFYFSKDAGPVKGSRNSGDPPINWLDRQMEAHVDGSDGGVGIQAMGELEVEGIYPLAYLRMLTGKTVNQVYATTTAHFHQAHVDNDVDDLSSVSLVMDDGVIGSLCIGRIGASSHPDLGEIKIHVIGSEGALVISEARPEVALYYRGQPAKEFRRIRVADENNYLLCQNFLDAIELDGQTILNVEAARDICAVVHACIRSGKSGRLEEVI